MNNSNSLAAKDHWDRVYSSKLTEELGWYEAQSLPSFELIQNCNVSKASRIIDIGSGTSTLIPGLLDEGYQEIIALDISHVALSQAKSNLGEIRTNKVQWIIKDVTADDNGQKIPEVTIWHDRAVLHFLTTEFARERYHAQLMNVVVPGGYVIISAFALDGAKMCSGIEVERYDTAKLRDFMGKEFSLVESFRYEYKMPSENIRPFVYTRFQRN